MMANTTISILRGTGFDSFGDIEDQPVVIASGVPAFLSSPGMSALRPLIMGTTAYPPSTEMPAIVRAITLILPGNTDLTINDQVLDEGTNITYPVYMVTQLGNVGGIVQDMQVTLRRITTTQPA